MKAITTSIILILSIFSIGKVNGYSSYYDDCYYNTTYNNSYNTQYYNNNCTDYKRNYYNDCYYNNSNSYYSSCYYNDYYINRNSQTQNAYRDEYIANKKDTPVSSYALNSYYGDAYYRNTDYTFEKPREDYYTESSVEELLDYTAGIPTFDLWLEELGTMSFKTQKNQTLYNDFYSQDVKMRQLILDLYDSGELSQYEVNGIVKNYKTFIYHTKQYFYYISLQEKNSKLKNDAEVNQALLKNYKSSREAFQKVKSVVLNR